MGAKYIFIILLILLAGCEEALQAVPTSEYQQNITEAAENATIDLCKDVSCPEGQICKNGKCTCTTGKLCNNKCIPSNSCCKDSECPSKKCDEGKCAPILQCDYNEAFKDGECGCATDYTYCKEQGKCIQKGDCCVHSQCPSFERCVETNLRTSFCLKLDEKKVCRLIADNNRTEVITIKDNEFRVTPKDWLSNGGITVHFNNENITILSNKTESYVNASMNASVMLFYEGIDMTGGFCKEDEED